MATIRPIVSILCTTYNQYEYIKTAVDSFLAQKTSFPFEILINDDCSTDGTTQIVLEYEKKYPDIIRVVTHRENQFRKVKSVDTEFLLPLVKGEYVAFCEGDDFWIDEGKLQKQYDALKKHKDCRFCVHASIDYHAQQGCVCRIERKFNKDSIVPRECFIENIHPFATATYFVETSLYREYAQSELSRLQCHGDQKMSVFFSMKTRTFYLDRFMSVYRVMAKGSINSSIQKNANYFRLQKTLYKNRVELLEFAKRLDKNELKQAYESGIDNMEFVFYLSTYEYKKARKKYPNKWEVLGKAEKLSYLVKAHLPQCCLSTLKVAYGLFKAIRYRKYNRQIQTFLTSN